MTDHGDESQSKALWSEVNCSLLIWWEMMMLLQMWPRLLFTKH